MRIHTNLLSKTCRLRLCKMKILTKRGELEGDRGLIKRLLAWKVDPLTKVKKNCFDRCHESGLAVFQKGKDVRYYWTS